MIVRESTNVMSKRNRYAQSFLMKPLLVRINQPVNGRCILKCKSCSARLRLSYKCRKEIGAIVHTHSPTLLSFAISHSLPCVTMVDKVFTILGEVSEVPYCICGGSKLVRIVFLIHCRHSPVQKL